MPNTPAPKILNELTEMVPIGSLTPHFRNANEGDYGAIETSMKANGFFGALVCQKSTGYILCGNHRFLVAQRLGYRELPVTWVDVDDDRALRILLALSACMADASQFFGDIYKDPLGIPLRASPMQPRLQKLFLCPSTSDGRRSIPLPQVKQRTVTRQDLCLPAQEFPQKRFCGFFGRKSVPHISHGFGFMRLSSLKLWSAAHRLHRGLSPRKRFGLPQPMHL